MLALEEYPHERLQAGDRVHFTEEKASPCVDAEFVSLTDTMKGEVDLRLPDGSEWMEVEWAYPPRRRSWHYEDDHHEPA